MSQTKSIRQARLVQTEGREDKAWCHLLKMLYSDSSLYSITIESAHGGSPAQVVIAAHKKQRLVSGAYHQVVAIVDGDKTEAEIQEAQQLADKFGIELIIINPCMEALLLNILEPDKNWYSISKGHKSYFEKKYIKPDRRTQYIHYEKVFETNAIRRASDTDPSLARIIEIISGGDLNKVAQAEL